jgi:hypothetical protein
MLLEVFWELSPDEFIISKKPIHANRLFALFAKRLRIGKNAQALKINFLDFN